MDPETYEKRKQRHIEAGKRAFKRMKNKMISKRCNSLMNAMIAIKAIARQDTWSTNHANCFRCSFGENESDAHINKKFELWKEYRKIGATVFCELILKDGSRPDLIICFNNGQIKIIEVVCSEKKESIINKKNKYPFPLEIIKTKLWAVHLKI